MEEQSAFVSLPSIKAMGGQVIQREHTKQFPDINALLIVAGEAMAEAMKSVIHCRLYQLGLYCNWFFRRAPPTAMVRTGVS
jgi:hypothetical protein